MFKYIIFVLVMYLSVFWFILFGLKFRLDMIIFWFSSKKMIFLFVKYFKVFFGYGFYYIVVKMVKIVMVWGLIL